MKTNLSKTTQNFLKARGIEAKIHNLSEYYFWFILSIYSERESELNDSELTYKVNPEGTFTYTGNTWLDKKTENALPEVINDEKHLRTVIKFIHKQTNKK